ncbi:MAG: hypothetical protein GXO76_04445 [Calditrichaeota bacterium]|nr:hypothetical protein [Calditrichota bacterium]
MKSEQAVEDIQFIREMIEKTKKSTVIYGDYFITWGVLIILALLGNYVLAYLKEFQLIWANWVVFMGVGIVYSIIYPIKKKNKMHIRTYAGKTLANLWTACGVAFILTGFVFPLSGLYSYKLIPVLISTIAGVGTFVTGSIYDWSIFKWSGSFWWIGAVVMIFLPSQYYGLLLILLIGVGYLLPGIQLNRHYGESGGAHASTNK